MSNQNKTRVNLFIDKELRKEAGIQGLNLSQFLEKKLRLRQEQVIVCPRCKGKGLIQKEH